MSTEYSQENDRSPGERISPTKDWVNLGGGVNNQQLTLTAPIYSGGNIYAFAWDANNRLKVCTINSDGKGGKWKGIDSNVQASPAAAVARDSGVLGVLCKTGATSIEINYVDPSNEFSNHKKSLTDNLTSKIYFSHQVKLIRNANGSLEVFALDNGGNMWHTVETNNSKIPGEWGPWKTIGSGFNVGVSEFKVIPLNGGQGVGPFQVVAFGAESNPSVYQATQVSGSPGIYNAFSAVDDSSSLNFSGSPAAVWGAVANNAIYAIYNSIGVGTANPLTTDVGKGWNSLSLTNDYPAAGDSIVLAATGDGITRLVWMDAGLQVHMLSRDSGKTDYWGGGDEPVGGSGQSFTGAISAVVNDFKVGLFQTDGYNNLWFINFLPTLGK